MTARIPNSTISLPTAGKLHGMFFFGLYSETVSQISMAILRLFTGERSDYPPSLRKVSAQSLAGLCLYSDALRDLSDSQNFFGLYHLIPGRIEYCGRTYDWLQDGEPQGYNISEDFEENSRPSRLQRLKLRLSRLNSHTELAVYVKKLPTSLHIWYEIIPIDGSEPIVVPPAALTETMATARGFQHCSGAGCAIVCEEINDLLPNTHAKKNICGKEISLFTGTKLSRCAAMSGVRSEYQLLLRSHKCIQCCLRAAVACSRKRVLIVSSTMD